MTNVSESALEAVEARIAWVLDHAGITPWLKKALREAVDNGDPVTAGNDAEILRNLLQARSAAWAQHQLKLRSAQLR